MTSAAPPAPLVTIDALGRKCPIPIIMLAERIRDVPIGQVIAVLADQHLIAGSYYQALGRPWGPSLRADQVIGGGALWILGDLVGLPFLAASLIVMIREDEREAAQVDAELDAKAAEAAVPGAGEAGRAPAATPDSRPWWESDSRFTGRFQRPGSD